MPAQTNNQIARKLMASPIDLPLAEDVIAEDHAQGCVFSGRAAVEALLREFFVAGFPNARARSNASSRARRPSHSRSRCTGGKMDRF